MQTSSWARCCSCSDSCFGASRLASLAVSKHDELCITNEKMFIKSEEFGIKNEVFLSEMMNLVSEMMNFVSEMMDFEMMDFAGDDVKHVFLPRTVRGLQLAAGGFSQEGQSKVHHFECRIHHL